MKAREGLSKLSLLALQKRRQGLVKLFPPVAETLRGSLIERYLTCGNPNCKCARGQRHGPVWYLTVTLGPGRTTGTIVPVHLLELKSLVQVGGEGRQRVGFYFDSSNCNNRETTKRLPTSRPLRLALGLLPLPAE